MAQKKRFLDVWLVESNTVYREVPYLVVADWVQQSRLLADDMVRRSGTKDWFKIGSSPELAAYVPQSKPYEVEDQAEALEPVEMGFSWKGPRDDEDDDPDMIPLIDVSLVLLIFFMMAGALTSFTGLQSGGPAVVHGEKINPQDLLYVSLTREDGKTIYSAGIVRPDESSKKKVSFKDFEKDKDNFDEFKTKLLALLSDMEQKKLLTVFNAKTKKSELRVLLIDADEDVPSGDVHRTNVALLPYTNPKDPKVRQFYAAVEKKENKKQK